MSATQVATLQGHFVRLLNPIIKFTTLSVSWRRNRRYDDQQGHEACLASLLRYDRPDFRATGPSRYADLGGNARRVFF
jgi:hypothetical protein